MFQLDGKVVIVTGGGGLLGRQYVEAIAKQGGHAIAWDIDDNAVTSHAATVTQQTGNKSLGMSVNITDKAAVVSAVEQVLAEFGRIDGLVNNAAINPKFDDGGAQDHTASAFENFSLEQWNQSLAVNTTGMFLCTQAVVSPMLEQGSGSIVNVSSTYGINGPDQRLYEPDDPNQPRSFKPVTYTVTKSAVIGFTKYLAAYYGKQGIRVNTLTPGGVYNAHEDEFVVRYSSRTPMGRMADKHEYNGALVYLLSDESSYMTGANLIVDGGWSAW